MSATADPVENPSLEDRLYTIKYEEPEESHLDVKDSDVCQDTCTTDDCSAVCPADVWVIGESGVPKIAFENCLECSSCRYACPYDNVIWTYPERGAGVTYKYG